MGVLGWSPREFWGASLYELLTAYAGKCPPSAEKMTKDDLDQLIHNIHTNKLRQKNGK